MSLVVQTEDYYIHLYNVHCIIFSFLLLGYYVEIRYGKVIAHRESSQTVALS